MISQIINNIFLIITGLCAVIGLGITYSQNKNIIGDDHIRVILLGELQRFDEPQKSLPKDFAEKTGGASSGYSVYKYLIINTTHRQINPEDYASDLKIVTASDYSLALNGDLSSIGNNNSQTFSVDESSWQLESNFTAIRFLVPRLLDQMLDSSIQLLEIKNTKSNSVNLGRPLMKSGDYFIIDLLTGNDTPSGTPFRSTVSFQGRIKNADFPTTASTLIGYDQQGYDFSFKHTYLGIFLMAMLFASLAYIPITFMSMTKHHTFTLYVVYLICCACLTEMIVDYVVNGEFTPIKISIYPLIIFISISITLFYLNKKGLS